MSQILPQYLMLPGPTPLPQAVLQALSGPMINHRGPEFAELFREIEAGLKWVFQTQHRVLMLTGSGTTGMEAALTNLFSPGDKVLALSNGSFGERFGQMAEIYGLEVERLAYEWGEIVSPQALSARLEADTQKQIKAVLVVHNETSAGVLNPLRELSEIISRHGALSIVDAISSLTSTPVQMDEWQLDVVLGASQKGLMVPPGLAFVALSPKAWVAHRSAELPRFSLDFSVTLEYAEQGWTPWTPPISIFHGLRVALAMMREEGLEAIQARHLLLRNTAREGLEQLGLRLMIENPDHASCSVTPVYPPEGLSADLIRSHLHQHYNMVLGGGQRKLTGQIFRIGHLGYQFQPTIWAVLQALEAALSQLQKS
ncbi:aminotransferase [bacterium (Candidatus Blackallbacteria) CG17_big_fil_post_rev_8_21_14_2_50_48_46]|uniref:Aminotransferase n=1 Tax=bacterium (Candidatus Blackallbacteria) CG17_big_fil_post_rev_8_21_14_2_50_48_46 TaxID=2014261 RepID=A0A2M7G6H1_9BACT|nr:MAG: aminotransferase [bacterium (Candidatus Blackallbacteria) CG18_big_fil_WC_8_21_14_2_50_49_26]PIW17503.1 MAG: aminotransferase [bacterium (Candidatus Blackallbacteria) CG17_big_fil_post_rev_8_21_14_2_50_48_46]PIW48357.1 MAG: aminotransferase [bacterium (Candidatus Blackallbacteria) CG13_big_fil_rev_8_21_14_2_50_49_14]